MTVNWGKGQEVNMRH